MKRSTDHILTTHVGSLPRPPDLLAMLEARETGQGFDEARFEARLAAAVREIVEKHDGEMPSDYDAVLELPGVGQYMAGAIMSIAFNKPYPVVDGNVRRVLSRAIDHSSEW